MALALLFIAAMNRSIHQQFGASTLVLPAVLAAALLGGSACHPKPTVVSIYSAAVGGTIAGVVTGPADATLADRTVTIVNVENGAQYHTATGQTGAYSLHVPAGKYRLEVQLRPGEQLAEKQPTILLNLGEFENNKDVHVDQNHQ